MDDLFDTLAAQDTSRCIVVSDPPSGLRAFIVIDDTTLGPAAGGIRTRRYGSTRDALEEAALLARAMTLKCALAGVRAGGGAAVVMEHPGLDRERGFKRLGQRIEELGGLFRAASDLGTSERSLAAVASATRYVAADQRLLADAVARGLVGCIRTCAALRDKRLDQLRIAIQGCGKTGSALARALAQQGSRLIVSDLDLARARVLARELDAEVCSAVGVLLADVDVVCPCASGGVLDVDTARRLRAWAVCGAANNQLGDAQAGQALFARDILFVPDPIASAGGIIRSLCLDAPDRGDALIDRLAETAREILDASRRDAIAPQRIAEARAWERIRRG